jgi:hypothetical protein
MPMSARVHHERALFRHELASVQDALARGGSWIGEVIFDHYGRRTYESQGLLHGLYEQLDRVQRVEEALDASGPLAQRMAMRMLG